MFIVSDYVGLEGIFDQGVGGGGGVEAQHLANEVRKRSLLAGVEVGKAGVAGKFRVVRGEGCVQEGFLKLFEVVIGERFVIFDFPDSGVGFGKGFNAGFDFAAVGFHIGGVISV